MQTGDENNSAPNAVPDTARLAAIRISGHDRISFLQGQLTQDVTLLTPAKPLLAGWASAKGRLLCAPWIADWHEAVWLVLPGELAATVTNRLKMFVLRADVQVELTAARVRPASLDQLSEATKSNNTLDNSDINHCLYNDNEFSIIPAGGVEMGIRIQPGLPETATEPATIERWRLLNIRAGLPLIGAAVTEEFVPQMVNLDLLGAISFTKGCYVGQEIVARTQNLGRIKRRMYAFNMPTAQPVAPGQAVYGRQGAVGQIVDAVVTATGTEMLAVIRIDSLEDSLSMEPDGQQPLTRLPLPYAIP
jgi:folate-binding protein YgfZ